MFELFFKVYFSNSKEIEGAKSWPVDLIEKATEERIFETRIWSNTQSNTSNGSWSLANGATEPDSDEIDEVE